jgi:hypothetical protein
MMDSPPERLTLQLLDKDGQIIATKTLRFWPEESDRSLEYSAHVKAIELARDYIHHRFGKYPHKPDLQPKRKPCL